MESRTQQCSTSTLHQFHSTESSRSRSQWLNVPKRVSVFCFALVHWMKLLWSHRLSLVVPEFHSGLCAICLVCTDQRLLNYSVALWNSEATPCGLLYSVNDFASSPTSLWLSESSKMSCKIQYNKLASSGAWFGGHLHHLARERPEISPLGKEEGPRKNRGFSTCLLGVWMLAECFTVFNT